MPIPGTLTSAKIISLTGDLGSGKSTVGEMLAQKWGVRRYYAGGWLRNWGAARGLSILEASRAAAADPTIDDQIDAAFRDMAQSNEDAIAEGRVAWHFLPQSFKIKLTVCPQLAAERIYRDKKRSSENVDTPDQIIDSIRARKENEVTRYKKIYGIDMENDANYNLIIDTSSVTPDDVVTLIDRLSPMFFSGQHIEGHWISPRSLYPSIMPRITESGLELPDDEFDHTPITVIDLNRLYLIVDGHTRTSKAVMAGVPFIPVRCIGALDMVPGRTITGLEFYRRYLDFEAIQEWAKVHGFNYLLMPERP
jgi:predicted cytidylate kinase